MLGLKSRAQRRKVQIGCRMRNDLDWIDLTIRNVSRTGLMAETDDPPSRGHYIEIRRFEQIIVGRVVWSSGRRFGVISASPLDVSALIDGKTIPDARERRNAETRAGHARPSFRRLVPESHGGWRRLGRLFEKGAIVGFGIVCIGGAAALAFETLDMPLSMIGVTLDNSDPMAMTAGAVSIR